MPVPKAQQKWGLPIRSFWTYNFDTSAAHVLQFAENVPTTMVTLVGIRLNSTVLQVAIY